MPIDTIKKVLHGRDPKLLMNIHNVSGVNNPNIHLSEIDRSSQMEDFVKSNDFIKGEGESTQWGLPKE